MLIGLMERLTGREVKLVPPATMMLGARKHVPAGTRWRPESSNGSPPEVTIESVRPTRGGGSFRVGASYRTGDRGAGAVEVDVDRSVIQHHARVPERGAGPLRLELDVRAASSGPEQRLQVHHGSGDVVHVSADPRHVDIDA